MKKTWKRRWARARHTENTMRRGIRRHRDGARVIVTFTEYPWGRPWFEQVEGGPRTLAGTS